MNIFCFLVLGLNVIIPIFVAIGQIKNGPHWRVSYEMLICIQMFTCLVQFDACRRMYLVISQNKGCCLNIKSMIIHVTAYLVYLAGLIYYYIDFLSKIGSETAQQFTVAISIRISLSILSVMVLGYVFYDLCKDIDTPTIQQ